MTQQGARIANLEAALHELPIFPLPHVVLFPRALLPLHVFEPRYRALVRDCIATHGAFAVTMQSEPQGEKQGSLPPIREIAGGGVIIENQVLPDGRSNILVHGVARLRLQELPFVPPYRRARAEILHNVQTPVTQVDRTSLTAAAHAFVSDLRRRDPSLSFNIPPSLEPGAVADLCAHQLIIDAKVRQKILEELDVALRVRFVMDELAAQHGALLRDWGSLH